MKIEFTVRGLLTVFFRQKIKTVGIFLLIIVATCVTITLAKTEYEAAGSLLVKFGNTPASDIAPENNAPEIISQNDRREILESNTDILQSHNLLLSVVHEFGAERLYPGITKQAGTKDWPDEVAVRKLAEGDLWVKSSSQSDLIQVKLLNEDPVLAAQFVQRLFEVFMARQSEAYNKPQTAFLEAQVQSAKAKLDQSQQSLQAFRTQNGISSINDELDALLRQKADASDISLDSLDDAWAALAELQAKEAQMRQTYLPDSPQVARVHASVITAQQQLHTRQAELSSRTGMAKSQIDARIAKLEALRPQYEDLLRQVNIDEQNYKNYQLRNEDARINETLNQKNITPIIVIDQPTVPKRPVRPRKTIMLLVGLLSAVLFSVGTAILCETFDPRFSTPRQVSQALRIPVMASFDDAREGRA